MAPAKVNVRPASPDELAALRALRSAAADDLTARFGEGRWSTVSAVRTMRKKLDEGTLYAVSRGRELVGTFVLSDRKIGFYSKSWFARPAEPAAYLTDMAIGPEHQRQGVGRRVMREIETLCRANGLQALRFDAYDSDAGAGEFYRKCGYARVHRGSIAGVALEYYERQLEPAATSVSRRRAGTP